MKVKGKYFFIGCFVITIISAVILIFIVKNAFHFSFGEGVPFVENGFTLNPADRDQLFEYNSQSQYKIDVLHYKIDLELFSLNKIIKGNVEITGLKKSENLKNIVLNFYNNFEITKLTLNGKFINYTYEDNKLFIPADTKQDTFLLNVRYNGKPKSLGFGSFIFAEDHKHPVIYTLSEPIYASTWFPCNDMPSDKALSDVFITCDSSLIAVSNGTLKSVISENDKKTFHWKTIYPIATYLISFSAADYKTFSNYYRYNQNDSMRISYYVFPEDLHKAEKDFSIHPKAIKFYSDTFGQYPFLKEKYGVVEFLWKFGAMEHQTITAIGKNFISGSKFFTDILVHELSHQWWGDAVTLKSWKDIWLNEGFATYSEALYWENESGFKSLKSTMHSFLTNFDGTTLYNPKNLFSRIIYNKGAWVLHMLRREIGDKKFFLLLKKYFEKFKYKNSSTKDFMNLTEEISDTDLNQFFNQWVFDGKGLIKLEYAFNQKNGNNGNEILLKIDQIQDGYQNYYFPLDIVFNLKNDEKVFKTIRIYKRNNVFYFNLMDSLNYISFDPNGWLAFRINKISNSK